LSWRRFALEAVSLSLILLGGSLSAGAGVARPTAAYRLRLYETHTNEHIDVVYREGDRYIPSAVAQLDHFLRDHRTGTEFQLNPRLFDLLHDVAAAVGRPDAEINIVCGYRTPWSNAFLRRTTAGVAQHSLHMEGQAIDIRIPGVPTSRLRDAALGLHRGGVGYYPVSKFVHVDVGRVRRWQYPQRLGALVPAGSEWRNASAFARASS
jgi:uncharacterized protein YcbK (DUF882 family)